MLDTDRPSLNPEFTAEQFDEEMLLYSLSENRAVYLNDSAYLVWQLCGEGISVGEMIAMLEQTYPERRETIRTDVLAALETLRQSGVLTLAAA